MLQLFPKGPDLWDSILPEEARALREDLAHVDELLRDERFMAPFVRRFDERTGRRGLPVATYLRLMYLRRKHRLSYDALIEQVADSIQWRTFCGIGGLDRVPSSSTLAGLTQKYGEETLHELHALVSRDLDEWKIRRRRGLARGEGGEAARRPARRDGLVRRLARLPGIGPALGRILDRARAALSCEARGMDAAARPSAARLRQGDRKLLLILREAASRARRLVVRVKDRRLQREVQIALDLD
ncbi:MAG: transposase [Elusimicrobia bacterium]|nr:transposase [Elusimicrobiota bacterium]